MTLPGPMAEIVNDQKLGTDKLCNSGIERLGRSPRSTKSFQRSTGANRGSMGRSTPLLAGRVDEDDYVERLPDEYLEGIDAPREIDWREKGAVTRVGDQGECGSCWAFSAAGQIEGVYFLKHRKPVELSKQELIDCSGELTLNDACQGGSPVAAFVYIKLRGLSSEEHYNYTAQNGTCRRMLNKPVKTLRRIYSFEGEDNLKKIVGLRGPVAVTLDEKCDVPEFEDYEEGIYSHRDLDCDRYPEWCDERDKKNQTAEAHSVLVVGYGEEDGEDFWILKNSHDEDWGDEGYMRFPRGNNLCDVGGESYYVEL